MNVFPMREEYRVLRNPMCNATVLYAREPIFNLR